MTAHQKIMRAAKRGTGLRLTAKEISMLSMDQAIEQAAANDDAEDDSQTYADAGEPTERCVW